MKAKLGTSIRLAPETAARLKALAEIEDTSVSELLSRGAHMVLGGSPHVDMVRHPGVWRVGRKLGRTLYRDEEFMGIMDSPAVAAEIVAVMNGTEAR